MTVKIIVGDCLPEMRKMPANSIHCVVTSSPYWGLRDYGIDPSIWGGDPDCEHDFVDEITLRRVSTTAGLEELGERYRGGGKKYGGAKSFEIVRGSCLRCGAWRGALGLEPTPDLFVDHLVEVMEEVRRVLRPDGSVWLNLGDSYASATERGNGGDGTSTLTSSGNYQEEAPRPWARRPERGETSIAGHRGAKARADRDGTHAGKHTAMTAIGPMAQPNRLPIAGLKPKDLVGVPWMAAFALRRAGWWLRQEIIWAKPNPMPESTEDRCTKAHESIFLLTKSARYFYDAAAIAEPASTNEPWARSSNAGSKAKEIRDDGNHSGLGKSGLSQGGTRNKRSVWTVATQPFKEAHFATFPPALIEPCVMAGTSERGCCPACQAPWERVTAKSRSNESNSARAGNVPDGKGTALPGHGAGSEDDVRCGPVITTVSLGWWPTCGCDNLGDLPPYPQKPSRAEIGDEGVYQAELRVWLRACDRVNGKRRELCDAAKSIPTVPAVVLDPFGGAGTTGLVADRLQRDAVLVERNPGYAAMARTRIDGEAPLFAARAAE